jgi:hypothetical protein
MIKIKNGWLMFGKVICGLSLMKFGSMSEYMDWNESVIFCTIFLFKRNTTDSPSDIAVVNIDAVPM